MKFGDIEGKDEYIEAVREYCVNSIGYFIEPKYLFGTLAKRAKNGEFIIEDLGLALKYIEDSLMDKLVMMTSLDYLEMWT